VFPDYHKSYRAGVLNVDLTLSDLHFESKIQYDEQKSFIEVFKTDPVIKMRLNKMDFVFENHYKLLSDPLLVEDEGDGFATIEGLTLNMDFTPMTKDGKL
jgi:hypothetical protein